MRSARSHAEAARAALGIALVATLAAGCGETDSTVGAAQPASPGLVGDYFSSIDFNDEVGTFVDPNIDLAAPKMDALFSARGIEPRSVSVRWTGQIHLVNPESYALFIATSGRVRVRVSDQVVIDHWEAHPSVAEYSGAVPAGASGWRDLAIDFDQAEGALNATLLFASDAQPKVVVPPEALRHLP